MNNSPSTFKKITIFLITIGSILLMVQGVFADSNQELEDLAKYESLSYDVSIIADFTIEESGPKANLQEATATLLLKAQEQNNYVSIISESTSTEGQIIEGTSKFIFTEITPNNKQAIYNARVHIDSSAHQIQSTQAFPIQLTEEEITENNLAQYLQVTETIDWTNQDILIRASSLAQGQTDLFETMVTIASWVEQNIEYNLSTLNVESSHPASTVLEKREGVCDEMTSLFISFARSLGIPARFVSGLTYTRSDLFDEPWQSHGWAEIYLPEIGWISFDPTFGQYGFVDATHIPLQYSVDPTEASIYYEWTANDIQIQSEGINFEVEVTDYGRIKQDTIELETEEFSSSVNFGSHNLISTRLRSQDRSYKAVELQLVTPKEITIHSPNTKVIVLAPNTPKTEQWIVQVEENLQKEYIYNLPYYVFANNKMNGSGTFSAGTFNPRYDYQEINSLITATEDNSAESKISVICSHQNTTKITESTEVTCTTRNTGNKIIQEVNLCIASICEKFPLLLSEEKEINQSIRFEEAGFQNIAVSTNYDEKEISDVLTALILDEAKIRVNTDFPNNIKYKETVNAKISLEKESVATPQNVQIQVTTPTEVMKVNLSELSKLEIIDLTIDSSKFTTKNEIEIQISWQDEIGQVSSYEKIIPIQIEGQSIIEDIKLFINKIVLFFTM